MHAPAFLRIARWLPVAAAVLALPVLTAGCDLLDDEDRDEDLDLLLGSWRVQDLVVDNVSIKTQLNAQYDRLVLTLREDGSGNEFFTVIGQAEGTEQDLFVQGTFFLDSDDDQITLFPDSGPSIELFYTVSEAAGLRMRANDGDEEDFLQLLRIPVQGDVDDLRAEFGMDP